MYKIVTIIRLLSEEKAKSAAYQLKGFAQVCCSLWKDERVEASSKNWEYFEVIFLNILIMPKLYLPIEA